jgi:hypothetical protein
MERMHSFVYDFMADVQSRCPVAELQCISTRALICQYPGNIRNGECRLSSSYLGKVRLISSGFQEVSGMVNAVSPVPTWERYG